jgi:hypothetical protein
MIEGVIRAPRGAESEILKAGFVILNIRSVACQQCECSSEWYDFTVEGPREALEKLVIISIAVGVGGFGILG